MSASQRKAALIPRGLPVTPAAVILIVHTASIACILIRVAVESDVVSGAAAVKVTLADWVSADRLRIRGKAGSPRGKADGDCIRWTISKRLVSGRGQAGVAEWGTGARRIAVGTDGVGGAVPAYARVLRVVAIGTVQVVRRVEPPERGHGELRRDIAACWDRHTRWC